MDRHSSLSDTETEDIETHCRKRKKFKRSHVSMSTLPSKSKESSSSANNSEIRCTTSEMKTFVLPVRVTTEKTSKTQCCCQNSKSYSQADIEEIKLHHKNIQRNNNYEKKTKNEENLSNVKLIEIDDDEDIAEIIQITPTVNTKGRKNMLPILEESDTPNEKECETYNSKKYFFPGNTLDFNSNKGVVYLKINGSDNIYKSSKVGEKAINSEHHDDLTKKVTKVSSDDEYNDCEPNYWDISDESCNNNYLECDKNTGKCEIVKSETINNETFREQNTKTFSDNFEKKKLCTSEDNFLKINDSDIYECSRKCNLDFDNDGHHKDENKLHEILVRIELVCDNSKDGKNKNIHGNCIDFASSNCDRDKEESVFIEHCTEREILRYKTNPIFAPEHTPEISCLIPDHIKFLIGKQSIKTSDMTLLILEWKVHWLIQQQNDRDPPLLYNGLRNVVSSYRNFEDYYNTYFPLLMIETWNRIHASCKSLNERKPLSCKIISYSIENHYVKFKCKCISDASPSTPFPKKGSIIVFDYGTNSCNYTVKIFGYVTQSESRQFNPDTDFILYRLLTHEMDTNSDSLRVFSFTFISVYNYNNINKHLKLQIYFLRSFSYNFRQNDALLAMKKSSFQRSILDPTTNGVLRFSLSPETSTEKEVCKYVQNIKRSILFPRTIPSIAVVKINAESDGLKILFSLIHQLKIASKEMKLLLCVRTLKTLGDIAENLNTHQDMKWVIVNNLYNTYPKHQKFLLDNLSKRKSKEFEERDEREIQGEKNLEREFFIKIKKKILKDTDIVLSLVKHFLDDSFIEAFQEAATEVVCIIYEANLCTEPETLIPILHGIKKLVLFGVTDKKAFVISKAARSHKFNQSFFQRAYDTNINID